jgi:hypothetical protein
LAFFTFATGAGRVAGAAACDPSADGCVAALRIFIAVQLASVITAAAVTTANADCFICLVPMSMSLCWF